MDGFLLPGGRGETRRARPGRHRRDSTAHDKLQLADKRRQTKTNETRRSSGRRFPYVQITQAHTHTHSSLSFFLSFSTLSHTQHRQTTHTHAHTHTHTHTHTHSSFPHRFNSTVLVLESGPLDLSDSLQPIRNAKCTSQGRGFRRNRERQIASEGLVGARSPGRNQYEAHALTHFAGKRQAARLFQGHQPRNSVVLFPVTFYLKLCNDYKQASDFVTDKHGSWGGGDNHPKIFIKCVREMF